MALLGDLAVRNHVPNPRLQSMVMLSLYRYHKNFMEVLAEPSNDMSPCRLECMAAVVDLIAGCSLGKNSTTETMAQALLPLGKVP